MLCQSKLSSLALIAVASLLVLLHSCGANRAEPAPQQTNTIAQQPIAPSPIDNSRLTTLEPVDEQRLAGWIGLQLKAKGASLVKVSDRKPWPSAPAPNVSIVLGLASHPADEQLAKNGIPVTYFPFVLLLQSESGETSPKLLGLVLQTDLSMSAPNFGNEENRPEAVDVGPFKIRDNEYAFGVTVIIGTLGMKSGLLTRAIGLFRYHDSELKEIYRDVLWTYSLYSDPDYQSCNVETEIVTQPSTEGGFYTVTRQYKASYLGNAFYYAFHPIQGGFNPRAGNTPVSACSLTRIFEPPYIETWNNDKGIYVDHNGRFLREDDFFDGTFPR